MILFSVRNISGSISAFLLLVFITIFVHSEFDVCASESHVHETYDFCELVQNTVNHNIFEKGTGLSAAFSLSSCSLDLFTCPETFTVSFKGQHIYIPEPRNIFLQNCAILI